MYYQELLTDDKYLTVFHNDSIVV